ncbi:hypothetical protein [Anoxybacillus sp. KU2-6(11)]|uniref:Ger(x)C family spore germination protein n=1 Tax=Anoxybacillus sp. KU2-6(11) TaxID=1535751 RepID=UPI000A716A13|nr:hypothetical protein [Anoxybacillus sp. KU2-6(11)]
MKWMIVCMLLLSGCVQPRVLERQGIITAAGFDKKGKLYEAGSVMLSFQTAGSSMSEVIEATNKTSKGIRQDLEAQTSHDLGSGQIRIVVYGKELAEQEGISVNRYVAARCEYRVARVFSDWRTERKNSYKKVKSMKIRPILEHIYID